MTPTLFIAGDSTAAIKGAGEKPMTGWGEYLHGYFGISVRIENRAINGRSTKSFITDGRLEDILKDFKAGDYLFIQFGHNDEKKEDPLRYTDPDTEYRRNLIQYIEAARQLGGTPVLLTSVSRRRFNSDGELDPLAVGAYPEAMKQVAEETHTPLLDIFAASQVLYRSLGVEESKSYSCICLKKHIRITQMELWMILISLFKVLSTSPDLWFRLLNNLLPYH